MINFTRTGQAIHNLWEQKAGVSFPIPVTNIILYFKGQFLRQLLLKQNKTNLQNESFPCLCLYKSQYQQDLVHHITIFL